MMERNQAWHIAIPVPQSDRWAAENLRQRGYVAYQPIFPKTIRHFRNGPNKVRTVMRAMFPGYLFVQLGRRSNWGGVEDCPGFRATHNFLRQCGSADHAILPDTTMEQIRAKEAELCAKKRTLAVAHGFKPGQTVRIEEGPFTGFLAQIETLDDHERIGLLMSMFGRESRVSLPAECLASVS